MIDLAPTEPSRLPLRSAKPGERIAAVAPFTGRLCEVHFGQFRDESLVGVVEGVSMHATNGNSTGDLVVRARPGKDWLTRGERHPLLSIALVWIRSIEPVDG